MNPSVLAYDDAVADEAGWDAAETLRIVDEGRVASGVNIDVFDDLGRDVVGDDVLDA